MTPTDLPAEESLRFLARALPPPPLRILEAGAGDGAVSLALAAQGYEVTALDESAGRPSGAGAERVRWIEADFLYHEEGPRYGAVLFTRSLHHISPLEGALDRARSLLQPGGQIIAEEFAFDRVNLPTARWYYDLESVLLAAGILEPAAAEAAPDGNPLGRWRQEHLHDPPLHTGHAMLAAARERFELGPAEETPYLYRYFCERMVGSDRGDKVARRILELESRLIRERDLTAAGLRFVGRLEG